MSCSSVKISTWLQTCALCICVYIHIYVHIYVCVHVFIYLYLSSIFQYYLDSQKLKSAKNRYINVLNGIV